MLKLWKFWELAKTLLVNQRGQLGAVDEFTDEEKTLLSLDEEPEALPGIDDSKPKPDETPGEPGGGEPSAEPKPKPKEPEESPRYQKRIDELTRGQREAQEKLELLESNPSEYYTRYPDKRPASYQAPAAPAATPAPRAAPQPLKATAPEEPVNDWDRVIEGGDYDGKVFKEVFEEDPAYAFQAFPRIATRYEWHQLDEKRRESDRQKQLKEENDREAAEFTDSLSQEYFKKPFAELTQEEARVIDTERNKTLAWIEDNTFYSKKDMLNRARFLMTGKQTIAKAAAAGANSLLEKARRGQVASISAHTESAAATGWEWWEKATPDQIAEAMDKMGDAKYQKFLKEAPESVRNRDVLTYLPWK